MTLKDQLDALLDAAAFDSTGAKIGAVRQVYVDDASGKLTFATVSTGIFSSDAIVPLHGARLLDDELHLDHTRSVIRDSPRPDHTEDALTPEQEATLLEYYGIEAPASGRDTTPPAPDTTKKKTTPKTTTTMRSSQPERAEAGDAKKQSAGSATPGSATDPDDAGPDASPRNRP